MTDNNHPARDRYGRDDSPRPAGYRSRRRAAGGHRPGLRGYALTLAVVSVVALVAAGVGGGPWSLPTLAGPPPPFAGGASPSMGAAVSATRPGPTASGPTASAVPRRGTGRFHTAPGGTGAVGTGAHRRYKVVVEGGSGHAPADFAAVVDAILADDRGWTAGGRWAFQRVAAAPYDFVVHLATPDTVDRLCGQYYMDTGGELSCRAGPSVVINLKRWTLGVPWYDDALVEYRRMVVNHEVGHFLGHNHEACPGPGRLAPVMQTQTLGLHGCRWNPWPYPDGRTYASGPPAP